MFFNSSDIVFHNVGPIKEKDSIPVFTLFAFGIDVTFFSSIIVIFSVSVIVKWDLVLASRFLYQITNEWRGKLVVDFKHHNG